MFRQILQPGETRQITIPVDLPPGRTVAAATAVTVQPRGLVAEVQPLTATIVGPAGAGVDVTVSGGTDGEIYLVAVRASSDAGDEIDAEVEIVCQDLSWAVPADGVAGSYIEPSEYVARHGLDETVRLTDEDGTGRIGRQALAAALADAAAEIEAHLAGRYQLPISPVPPLLRRIAGDLVRHRLHGVSAPDAVREAAALARQQLERLARGQMQLPSAQPKVDASTTPAIRAAERVFTREALKGW